MPKARCDGRHWRQAWPGGIRNSRSRQYVPHMPSMRSERDTAVRVAGGVQGPGETVVLQGRTYCLLLRCFAFPRVAPRFRTLSRVSMCSAAMSLRPVLSADRQDETADHALGAAGAIEVGRIIDAIRGPAHPLHTTGTMPSRGRARRIQSAPGSRLANPACRPGRTASRAR